MMFWRKIKQRIQKFLSKRTISFSAKTNPDSSVEFKLSISPQEDSKETEEMLQRYASKNIKTIGALSSQETFISLALTAVYFFRRGIYVASTRYAEEALRIEPRENNLRILLIKIYGNYIGSPDAKQKAVDMCDEAIKIEQNNYQPYFLKALYTSHLKKENDSIPLYLKAKELMEAQKSTTLSDYGQLCCFLGSLYLKESNYKDEKQAEILFRQAILSLQPCADEHNKFWLNHAKKLLDELLSNSQRAKDL